MALTYRVVRKLNEAGFDVVIHGDARGADRMAGSVAREIGMMVIPVPAKWEEHGRSAGPIRNRAMLKLGPDLVVAMHGRIASSKGTKDMLNVAEQAGVPTILIEGWEDLRKLG